MIISPSILSADFLNLERDIIRLEAAGADSIHIDIMDSVFTRNTTWGAPTITAIRNIISLPLEVHLMIYKPERVIYDYLNTEADIIIIHTESTTFLRRTLLDIKRYGVKAGIALKLETPIAAIKNCLDLIDMVLILTCDEGFGGELFQPLSLEKVSELGKWRLEKDLDFKIEVDGGIKPENGKLCKNAGADILVSGSYIFKEDMKTAIDSLRNI